MLLVLPTVLLSPLEFLFLIQCRCLATCAGYSVLPTQMSFESFEIGRSPVVPSMVGSLLARSWNPPPKQVALLATLKATGLN